jgi:hypothetical protein
MEIFTIFSRTNQEFDRDKHGLGINVVKAKEWGYERGEAKWHMKWRH